MRGKRAVSHFGYDRTVVYRILTDGHGAVFDKIDRTVICYIISVRYSIRSADVAVIDTICNVYVAGIDCRYMSAVVEYRVTARRTHGNVLQQSDRSSIVHHNGGVAVYVLRILKRYADDGHAAAGFIENYRGVIRNAAVADGVGCYLTAAGSIRDRDRAGVRDCSGAGIRCRRCGRSGMIIERSAVELERKIALVYDPSESLESVEIYRYVCARGNGVQSRTVNFFKRVAVRDKRYRGSRADVLHRFRKGGIILAGIAVICDGTLIRTEDINGSTRGLADRH